MRKKSKGLEEILMEEGILPKWIEKGRREGIREIARNLKSLGIPADKIARATGLTLNDIASL